MKRIRVRNVINHKGYRTLQIALGCMFSIIALSAFALAQSDQDRAWDILNVGVAEKSTERRAMAVATLGIIRKNTRAEGMAEKALEDEKPEVRAAGAYALGKMGAKKSIPQLKKALEDNEVSVALAASQALVTLGDPSGYEAFFTILTGERKTGSGMVDEQLKTFKNAKKMALMGFEEGINFIPFAGIGYGAFKAIRKDDATPVRAAAAKTLGDDKDPRSAQALVQATSDKSWLVRVAALNAIATRNDPSLLPGVEPNMADDKDLVRYTAAAVVIRLNNLPKALPKRAPAPETIPSPGPQ